MRAAPLLATVLMFACSPLCLGPESVETLGNLQVEVERSSEQGVVGTVIIGETEVKVYSRVDYDSDLADITCVSAIDSCTINYNPNHLSEALKLYGPQAVAYVWAHELGHVEQIISGRFNDFPRRHMELQADRRGGCAVALAGLPDDGIEDFMDHWFFSSETHPGPTKRLKAFREGYKGCSNE